MIGFSMSLDTLYSIKSLINLGPTDLSVSCAFYISIRADDFDRLGKRDVVLELASYSSSPSFRYLSLRWAEILMIYLRYALI